jgi:hypothetical protein
MKAVQQKSEIMKQTKNFRFQDRPLGVGEQLVSKTVETADVEKIPARGSTRHPHSPLHPSIHRAS